MAFQDPSAPAPAVDETAPAQDAVMADETGDDDMLVDVPLSIVADLQTEDGEDGDPLQDGGDGFDGEDPAGDEIVVTAPSPRRQAIAEDMRQLMGDDMDAEGVSADVIDAGPEMVLWGLPSSAEGVAVTPDLGDFTDPEAWLEDIADLDMDPSLEAAVEKLARAAAEALDGGDGEESVRRPFARDLQALFLSAGVDVLAVRKGSQAGFDWISLSPDDFARERDGEPWTPPGGFSDGLTLSNVGVALGLGGRVQVWPTAPAAQNEPDASGEQRPAQAQPRPAPRPQRNEAMS